MTENTDGTPAAEKAETETPTAEQATTPADDSGKQKDIKARIDGLTAETKRKDTQIEKRDARIKELEEQNKTEDEKRIDELAESKYGPKLQRAEQQEAYLEKKRDELIEKVPENYKGSVDANASFETQITQAENVLEILAEKQVLPKIDAGGNPVVTTVGVPTVDDYNRVVALAGSHKAVEQEVYDKEWPVIHAAIQAGKLVLPGHRRQ